MANVNSVSSSSNTSSLYGSRNVLSGLASGLDTESMIENSVKSYQEKIKSLEQDQTTAEWKQEALRTITDAAVDVMDKYTSYSAEMNLGNTSYYTMNAKAVVSGGYADAIKVETTQKLTSEVSITEASTATRAEIVMDQKSGDFLSSFILGNDKSGYFLKESATIADVMGVSTNVTGQLVVHVEPAEEGADPTEIAVDYDKSVGYLLDQIRNNSDGKLNYSFSKLSGTLSIYSTAAGANQEFSITSKTDRINFSSTTTTLMDVAEDWFDEDGVVQGGSIKANGVALSGIDGTTKLTDPVGGGVVEAINQNPDIKYQVGIDSADRYTETWRGGGYLYADSTGDTKWSLTDLNTRSAANGLIRAADNLAETKSRKSFDEWIVNQTGYTDALHNLADADAVAAANADQDYKDALDAYNTAEDDFSDKTEALDEAEITLEDAYNERDLLAAQIPQLEAERDSLPGEKAGYEAELQTLNNDLASMQGVLDSYNSLGTRLTGEMNGLTATQTYLSQQSETLNSQHTSLNETYQQSLADLNALTGAVTTTYQALTTAQTNYSNFLTANNLTEETAALLPVDPDPNSTYSQYHALLDAQTNAQSAYDTAASNYNQNYTQMNQAVLDAYDDLTANEAAIAENIRLTNENISAIADKQAEINANDANISTQQGYIRDQNAAITAKSGQIADVEARITANATNLSNAQARYTALTESNGLIKQAEDALTAAQGDLRDATEERNRTQQAAQAAYTAAYDTAYATAYATHASNTTETQAIKDSLYDDPTYYNNSKPAGLRGVNGYTRYTAGDISLGYDDGYGLNLISGESGTLYTDNSTGGRIALENVSTLGDVVQKINSYPSGAIPYTVNTNSAGVPQNSITNRTYTNSDKVVLEGPNGSTSLYSLFQDAKQKSADEKVAANKNKIDITARGRDASLTVTVDGRTETLTSTNASQYDAATGTFKLDSYVAGMTVKVNDSFETSGSDGSDAVKVKWKTDTTSQIDAVKSFVSDINNLMKKLHDTYTEKPLTQSNGKAYKPLTEDDESSMSESAVEKYEKKAKTGLLYGDSDLNRLYNEILGTFTASAGKYETVADPNDSSKTIKQMAAGNMGSIGITMKYTNGLASLEIDEDKLKAALEKDENAVKSVFLGDNDDGLLNNNTGNSTRSIRKTMNAYASTTSGSPGILVRRSGATASSTSMQNNTMKTQLEKIQEQIESWRTKMSDKVDFYTRQFTLLETLMNKMNNQSSMLASLTGG